MLSKPHGSLKCQGKKIHELQASYAIAQVENGMNVVQLKFA
jgi:hypothetical protein